MRGAFVERIIAELSEKGNTERVYVRPLCTLANVKATACSVDEIITVPCPEDEQWWNKATQNRRANGDRPNRASLIPLTEEMYEDFRSSLAPLGDTFGQHVPYRFQEGQWKEGGIIPKPQVRNIAMGIVCTTISD